MKNMNARDDVNIYWDATAAGYVVELLKLNVWTRLVVSGEFEAAHRSAAEALGLRWIEPMRFSQTFEVITPESAAKGEAHDTGYDWQASPESFRELVQRINSDYGSAHCPVAFGVPDSLTAEGSQEMRDGSVRSITLHPANERARRWWPKALRAAGLQASSTQ